MMKTFLSIHREISMKKKHFITIFYLMDASCREFFSCWVKLMGGREEQALGSCRGGC